MEDYLLDGMDRIEFRNSLRDIIIGNKEDGSIVKLKDLSRTEVINFLEEHINEMREDFGIGNLSRLSNFSHLDLSDESSLNFQDFLIDGMDRIEFRNSLMDIVVGNKDNGETVSLGEFKVKDIIEYLDEQVSEMKNDLNPSDEYEDEDESSDMENDSTFLSTIVNNYENRTINSFAHPFFETFKNDNSYINNFENLVKIVDTIENKLSSELQKQILKGWNDEYKYISEELKVYKNDLPNDLSSFYMSIKYNMLNKINESSVVNNSDSKITNNNLSDWMLDKKNTIVEYINSLNYNSLKEMFNECESSLKYHKELGDNFITPFIKKDFSMVDDLTCELEYIKKSLDYHKENISREQYGILNDFLNISYFHQHRNPDKENNRMNHQYWAELMDENNISWSLQNTVSALADNYENKGKYLSTHLKKEGIVVHECSYPELIQKRGEVLKEQYLGNKEENIETNVSKKVNKLR